MGIGVQSGIHWNDNTDIYYCWWASLPFSYSFNTGWKKSMYKEMDQFPNETPGVVKKSEWLLSSSYIKLILKIYYCILSGGRSCCFSLISSERHLAVMNSLCGSSSVCQAAERDHTKLWRDLTTKTKAQFQPVQDFLDLSVNGSLIHMISNLNQSSTKRNLYHKTKFSWLDDFVPRTNF